METVTYVEKFVPEVYKESRDFRVFVKLLDMICQTTKYDIDSWIKLYDAYECPQYFLPLLADMVGYKYDTKFTFEESRVIIGNFVAMLKNRGSKIGFKEALSILLNAKLFSDPNNPEYRQLVNRLSTLEIYFDFEEGKTTLYFPQQVDYDKNFMNYVRPIGTYLDFVVAEFPEPESDIAISTDVSAIKHHNFIPKVITDENTGEVISEDETYLVNKAQVNLSQLGMFEETLNSHNTVNDVTYLTSLNLNCYKHTGNYIVHNNRMFDIDTNSTFTIKFSGSTNPNFADTTISNVPVTHISNTDYLGFTISDTIEGSGGATTEFTVFLINNVESFYINQETNTIYYRGEGSCITDVYCKDKTYRYCEISIN